MVKRASLKKKSRAVQNQALRTKWVRSQIDNKNISSACRICGMQSETIIHVVLECSCLTENDYKQGGHDKINHWDFLKFMASRAQ